MLDETTIKTLRAEKAFLEGVMRNGRKQIKAIDAVLAAYDSTPPSTNGRNPRRQTATATQAGTSGEMNLREHIRSVLLGSKPLAPKEIRQALLERGLQFHDNTLHYHLRTSPLFEGSDGKWSLTEFDDE